MAAEITMIENVPVELNLGQPESIVGRATLSRDLDSGEITIEIKMFDDGPIKKLEDLVEIFDLKAIGFAGVKRRPRDGG